MLLGTLQLVVLCLGLNTLGLNLGQETESTIDPTGRLHNMAVRELARVAEIGGGGLLRLEDVSVLKSASLDPPFLIFGSDTLIFSYDGTKPGEILSYTNRIQVRYPIRLNDRIIGTVNLVPKDTRPFTPSSLLADRAWEAVGFSLEDGTTSRLRALSLKTDLRNGQRVSLLKTPVGTYYIIEDGVTRPWDDSDIVVGAQGNRITECPK
jgi:hypothetical protein